MGLITWNSGLETGLEAIDTQHQAMVEAYNELQNAIRDGAGRETLETALLNLRERTRRHFSAEEALMDEARYAGTQAHRDLHGDLLAQLRGLVDRFQADQLALTVPVMDFLGGWLVFHIKDEDARLVGFLTR
jgi:hemerythrin-like metal-binding protein